LALHFGFWITGLGLTAVASAVLLVTASPIFVATFDRIFFGQRLRALGWGGIGVSLAGTALVVGGDFHGTSLLGDGLALLGGIAVAAYTLAGRQARRSLGIFEYAFIAYAVAGICLFGATLVSHEALGGYDPSTWWAIAALIVGPQLLGHTIINLVLKDIDATAVSVTIMLEPVVATFLAFVLFAETPSALFYPGAVAILTGIFMTSLVTRPQPVVPE
jgi:drug/metabolite transporter (DMT)-like permease